MSQHRNAIAGLALLAVAAFAGAPIHAGGGHGATGATSAERIETGEHGGRILLEDGFRLELAIAEGNGLPAEFRAWAWRDGQPLNPSALTLEVRLQRLGGQTDVIEFKTTDDFLLGRQTIAQPHSFDVVVEASHNGDRFNWRYASHEGRTRIPEAIAADAGVATEAVGPATLHKTLTLTGRVRAAPDRVARVAARYPGAVTKIHAELYERVAKGDPLATVVANDSLQTTVLRAPRSGVVIDRSAAVGQQTGTQALFVIADLGRVWVELDAFPRDLAEVRVGQPVSVHGLDGTALANGSISRVAPTSGRRQNVHLVVPVENAEGALRPGHFVRGRIVVAEKEVALAVRRRALQHFRDFDVVYARFDDTYEVRMLELGKRDTDWVEVKSGIKPGTEYVSDNSFLIRADIEKSGASHNH